MTGEVEVTEAEYKEVFPDKSLDCSKGAFGVSTKWQHEVVSDGLAVLPKRIKEAEEFCARHGVPTDFKTMRGRPKIESRAQRKKLLRLFKLHDNDGGYGD